MIEEDYFNDYVENVYQPNNYIMSSSLSNTKINQRPFKQTQNKKLSEDALIYAADCESMTKGESHRTILMALTNINNEEVVYFESEKDDSDFDRTIIKKFSYYISSQITRPKQKVIIYFHNLKYDNSLFFKYLYQINEIEQNNTVYTKTYLIDGNMIEFRDSYKLFSKPLAELPQMFSMDKSLHKKEAIGYNYYTNETIHNNKVSIDEYKTHLLTHEHKTLIEILKKDSILFEYDEINQTFNPYKYYKHYLKYDVLVLRQALLLFNELMYKITGLNSFNILTISSLAHKFMCSRGCYEGLYEVKGSLRKWIQDSIYGGRVHVVEKHANQVVDNVLENNDAC